MTHYLLLTPPDEPEPRPPSGYDEHDLWLDARDAHEAWKEASLADRQPE